MNDPNKLINASAELVKELLKFFLPPPPDKDNKTNKPAD
jgi:hypothetical protein